MDKQNPFATKHLSDSEFLRKYFPGSEEELKHQEITTEPASAADDLPRASKRFRADPEDSPVHKTESEDFIFLEHAKISEEVTRQFKLKYKTTGSWSIFLDQCNVEAGWTKLTELYLSQKLFGIQKIARAKREKTVGRGYPLLAFTGNGADTDNVVKAGENLMALFQHKKQKCNLDYKINQIYFKLGPNTPVYEGGPMYYTVPY